MFEQIREEKIALISWEAHDERIIPSEAAGVTCKMNVEDLNFKKRQVSL